jgi:hypothetical protein
MGAGKNKSHRKKRISKHVIQAEERKKQSQLEDQLLSAADGGGGADTSPTSEQSHEVKRKKKETSAASASSQSPASKTKDPEEAASYLRLWKYDRDNKKTNPKSSGTWKFNKNTQSWLLRHMYDADKVNKTTYTLLIEYICQGGEGSRCRVEEDAKRRARRYKEWEKANPSQGGDGKDDKAEEDDGATKEKSQSKGKKIEGNDEKSEEELWNELNEHDKRKEYKRARKVMESLKAVREGGTPEGDAEDK